MYWALKRGGAGVSIKPGEPNSAMQSSHKQYPLCIENKYFRTNVNIKYISKGNSSQVRPNTLQTEVKPCQEPLLSLQK